MKNKRKRQKKEREIMQRETEGEIKKKRQTLREMAGRREQYSYDERDTTLLLLYSKKYIPRLKIITLAYPSHNLFYVSWFTNSVQQAYNK